MNDQTPWSGIAWNAEPLQPRKKAYKLVCPGPMQSVDGLIVNPCMEAILAHWIDGRTVPCTASSGACDGCFQSAAVKWKGFLAIAGPDYRGIRILEITSNALATCKALELNRTDLRGYHIRVSRNGPRRNSPCVAALSERRYDTVLPDAIDIRNALYITWGWGACLARQTRPNGGNP